MTEALSVFSSHLSIKDELLMEQEGETLSDSLALSLSRLTLSFFSNFLPASYSLLSACWSLCHTHLHTANTHIQY